jgi:hypothetical protein
VPTTADFGPRYAARCASSYSTTEIGGEPLQKSFRRNCRNPVDGDDLDVNSLFTSHCAVSPLFVNKITNNKGENS